MQACCYEVYQENQDTKTLRCNLCHHKCIIKDGERGICKTRENNNGILRSLVYGKIISNHVDPIKKKPIFHLMPGSLSYSIATVGCNFTCQFCQNHQISHSQIGEDGKIPIGKKMRPEDVIYAAEKENCKSISYTYTEPTVFFEFALDISKFARERNIKNIFVTNGYMSSQALELISPFLDAANVDLKAYNDKFYREVCGARLEPVKETLKLMKYYGILVEITTLIIPDLNDSEKELEQLAIFIADTLGTETPWHLSRFHPDYKLLNKKITPIETLMKAHEIGIKAGLKYVYVGNVSGNKYENTFCYQCGNLVIERRGFYIGARNIINNCCANCGAVIYGIGL